MATQGEIFEEINSLKRKSISAKNPEERMKIHEKIVELEHIYYKNLNGPLKGNCYKKEVEYIDEDDEEEKTHLVFYRIIRQITSEVCIAESYSKKETELGPEIKFEITKIYKEDFGKQIKLNEYIRQKENLIEEIKKGLKDSDEWYHK